MKLPAFHLRRRCGTSHSSSAAGRDFPVGRASSRAGLDGIGRNAAGSPGGSPHRTAAASGFTMIEIAICLAIIGFALVAILGVLPIGMNTQRDNRQETIVNQDATVLFEAIRTGAHGLDYLTNYVYAITNAVTPYDVNGQPGTTVNYGYTYASASYNDYLTNGVRIVGLLSTPEFTDGNNKPIPSIFLGGYSNHVVAYVRSLSGLAAEKPPQDNAIMRDDTFSYRLFCVNAPMAVDTNLFGFGLGPWNAATKYVVGDQVLYNWTYWRAVADNQNQVPDQYPALWDEVPMYPLKLALAQRELRMTFLWPLYANGKTGPGRHTFRATIAGQLGFTNYYSQPLYFYQPQSFTNSP